MYLEGAVQLVWVSCHPCFSKGALLQFPSHSWPLAACDSKPTSRNITKGEKPGLLPEANLFGENSDFKSGF